MRFSVALLGCPVEGTAVNLVDEIRVGDVKALIRPAAVYAVVSDYAGYGQWLPGLVASRLLARESNFATAEFAFTAGKEAKLSVECIHVPVSLVVVSSLSGNWPAVKIEFKIAPAEGCQSLVTLRIEVPWSLRFLTGRSRAIFQPQERWRH